MDGSQCAHDEESVRISETWLLVPHYARPAPSRVTSFSRALDRSMFGMVGIDHEHPVSAYLVRKGWHKRFGPGLRSRRHLRSRSLTLSSQRTTQHTSCPKISSLHSSLCHQIPRSRTSTMYHSVFNKFLDRGCSPEDRLVAQYYQASVMHPLNSPRYSQVYRRAVLRPPVRPKRERRCSRPFRHFRRHPGP